MAICLCGFGETYSSRQKSVFRGATRVLSSGTLASWMPMPLVRSGTPLASITQDGLRPVVLSCRMSPISSNAGLSGPGLALQWP